MILGEQTDVKVHVNDVIHCIDTNISTKMTSVRLTQSWFSTDTKIVIKKRQFTVAKHSVNTYVLNKETV